MNGKLINYEAMQAFKNLPGVREIDGVVTNYYPSLSSKLISYESQETKKIALVGDSIFLHPGFEGYAVKCVPPLPVFDELCFSILEEVCSRADKVFWSCGNEMVGCNFHSLIVNFPFIAPENRKIKYVNHSQRSFMGNGLYKRIPNSSIPILRQMFWEQIEYFLNKYSNLTIVPLLACRLEFSMLKDMQKYFNVYADLISTDRCLDLMDMEENDWADRLGHLSSSGAKKIKQKISNLV